MSGDERAKAKNPLPKTMDEALKALGENTVLKKALGEDFINDYIALCKEFQMDKLNEFSDKEPSIRFEAARKLFLYNL